MSTNVAAPAVRRPGKEPGWEELVNLWVHGRPESTLSVYKPVVAHFLNFIQHIPPPEVGLKHLQAFEDLFDRQKPRTVARKIATVKSLLSFAHRIGAISFDPGKALRCPHIPDNLAEKILPQKDIRKMIEVQPDEQNRVALMLLYHAGIRAAEESQLRWRDCRRRSKTDGFITVLGKGRKMRTIRLEPDVWQALMQLKPDNAAPDDFVFQSRSGWKRPLSRTRISNIVREAAKRAGIDRQVTAHWLRHGHATHALESGAPLPLISQTLGHVNIATTARYLHIAPSESSSAYVSLRGSVRGKKTPAATDDCEPSTDNCKPSKTAG